MQLQYKPTAESSGLPASGLQPPFKSVWWEDPQTVERGVWKVVATSGDGGGACSQHSYSTSIPVQVWPYLLALPASASLRLPPPQFPLPHAMHGPT